MAEIENLDFNPQNYNLQNHCGLYNIDNPLIYKNIIETSLNTGINVIGFNEVAPDTEYEIPIDKMYPTQLENYINEISNLRKTYKNRAEILCGLTVTNFEPQKLSHYISLKNKIDFLALDIKSNDSNEKNINYPLIYAEQVTKAMDTGLFDYVMHPDSFMAYIDNIAPIDKDEYQKNSKKAIDKICNKAKELNIPLEFDYTNLVNVNQNDYESLKIPSKEFWTRAVEFKNPVIGGNTTDLNNIYYLRTLENNRENYIPDLKTEQSYIPSIYKDTTLPYEYYLTISVLNNIQKAFKNTKELPASQVLIEGITPYYNYYNTLCILISILFLKKI